MEGKSLLPARSRGDRDRGRKLTALGPEGRQFAQSFPGKSQGFWCDLCHIPKLRIKLFFQL
jgi:hypothetical protein